LRIAPPPAALTWRAAEGDEAVSALHLARDDCRSPGTTQTDERELAANALHRLKDCHAAMAK
jgi:hypothetical protein